MMTDTRRRDARAYLMAEIDRLGEDFGPRSPLGLAINANAITDPRVLPWELYGAVLDILREEFQRHRNRRDGADATARNAQGRDDRRRLADEAGTGGLPPTPQRGEKHAISYVDWADGSTHDRTVFPELGSTVPSYRGPYYTPNIQYPPDPTDLKGSVLRYDDTFGSAIPPEDWEANEIFPKPPEKPG